MEATERRVKRRSARRNVNRKNLSILALHRCNDDKLVNFLPSKLIFLPILGKTNPGGRTMRLRGKRRLKKHVINLLLAYCAIPSVVLGNLAAFNLEPMQ